MNKESEYHQPIFIGGMYKSGTTLLRHLLGQNNNLYSGLETRWFDLKQGESDQDAIYITFLSSLLDVNEQILNKLFAETDKAEDCLDQLMQYCAKKNDKPRWLEKTPGNIKHINRIFKHWPESRFVHIVRDPRDVFAGRKKAKGIGLNQFIDTYHEFFQPARDILLHGHERFLQIRYEDLIRDTNTTMSMVATFLQLELQPAMLTFSGNREEYELVTAITGKQQTTLAKLTRPMSDQYIGVWKDSLKEIEVQTLERELADYFNLFDYGSCGGIHARQIRFA